ncbi:hypothetical protein Syun_025642 [Stephania yunnanensis]|uniref:Uncharacterized protein n=1 Tax=Stephania yunnanensis TaxID=152371 RepID=A0AAP0EXD9_9MAGN
MLYSQARKPVSDRDPLHARAPSLSEVAAEGCHLQPRSYVFLWGCFGDVVGGVQASWVKESLMSLMVTGSAYLFISTLKCKLILSSFLKARTVDMKPLIVASDVKCATMSFVKHVLFFPQVKANKPLWNVGSSFSIKKNTKSLPKVQIDDDLDLIDEDSLLTEEDLKKPQIPVVNPISNVYNFKVKAWSPIKFYKDTILPKLLEEK